MEGKMVKAKGDILQNINYLKRRVVESDAIQHDNTRCTRRTKENKRKSSKRKEKWKLNSCCKVIQEIIGLKDTAEQMMTKLEKGDFSFAIDDSDFIPEKLFTVKPKTHKSGLILLIEKNIFISWESKELAEEAVNNMEKATGRKFVQTKSTKLENKC